MSDKELERVGKQYEMLCSGIAYAQTDEMLVGQEFGEFKTQNMDDENLGITKERLIRLEEQYEMLCSGIAYALGDDMPVLSEKLAK